MRSEAKRRRCETLTEPLARQWGLLRTVCSVFPLLLSPSRSALSFSHSSPLLLLLLRASLLLFTTSLSPFRAHVLSYLVMHPRGAYNPTLRRRPRLVVIAYTRNTGKHHQHCAILRSCALTRRDIAGGSPSVPPFLARESHRRDSDSPYTAMGILNRHDFAYRYSYGEITGMWSFLAHRYFPKL